MRGAALLVAAACTLGGCERTMKDMYVQPKLGPDAASPLFADGKGSRPPPPGSIAMASGDLARTSSGRHGRAELRALVAADAADAPPPVDAALLRRGQERFDVDCVPCHSPLGDGDGMIVRRGFPAPPTFHQPRLREAPDRHVFDVITHGYGVMPAYADRVSAPDRWAIVAYVRALQLSQDAPAAGLPPDLRAQLAEGRAPASAPDTARARVPGPAPTPAAAPSRAQATPARPPAPVVATPETRR